MKKTSLFIASLAMGITMVSCGGGQSNQKEEDKSAKKSEKASSGKMDMTEKTVTVDPSASEVKWAADMVGIYTHQGKIKIKEGLLTVKGDKVTGGNIVIDMSTITPIDDNFDPEKGQTKDKLIGHLSSPDFFDVKNHPTAAFSVNSTKGKNVMGELMVRGKTGKESINLNSIEMKDGKLMASGKLTFNRKNYDVAYAMDAKDMVISDDIEVTFDVVAN